MDGTQAVDKSQPANPVEQFRREEPGAVLPLGDDSAQDPKNDFAWFDIIEQDDCFMPLDPSDTMPTKSLDFGEDGVTASVTAWHEMLQITAPDDHCGLVFVRGDFPDRGSAVLARAQRRNQRGMFGLELRVEDDSDFVLERSPGQGFINGRWPYTRLDFVSADPQAEAARFASCVLCSFVKDQTVYQVMRITSASHLGSAPPSETASAILPIRNPTKPLTVGVGGPFRFGCCNTARGLGRERRRPVEPIDRNEISPPGPPIPFYDKYELRDTSNGGSDYVLACESTTHKRRIEIRLWVNRKPIKLVRTSEQLPQLDEAAPEGFPDALKHLYAKHALPVYKEDKPIIVIAAISLVSIKDHIVPGDTPVIGSNIVQDHLGVSDLSISAPRRLWSAVFGETPGPDESSTVRFNAIGRCIEEIMGVLSVPVRKRPIERSARALPPSSQSNGSDRVDSLGAANGDLGIALVKTIIDDQTVDLESTLWHARLLSKASQKLATSLDLFIPPELATKRTNYARMREEYRDKLIANLKGILKWILNVLPVLEEKQDQYRGSFLSVSDVHANTEPRRCHLMPMDENSRVHSELSTRNQGRNRPKSPRSGRNPKWYCGLIIWYVIHHESRVLDDRDICRQIWEAMPLLNDIDNTDNDTDTLASDNLQDCVLRWYHSHSVVEISKVLGSEDPKRLEGLAIKLAEHEDSCKNWKAKAEKAVRLFGQGRLAHECIGHEVANLVLLGNELQTRTSTTMSTRMSSIEYIKELVRIRTGTRKLISGGASVERWDSAHTVQSATPRPAPWELSCLGHHLPLNLGIQAPPGQYPMEDCMNFQLADFTFIPSWDYSKACTAGLWWDLTTTSIICAKLLEGYQPKLTRRQPHSNRNASRGLFPFGSEKNEGEGAESEEDVATSDNAVPARSLSLKQQVDFQKVIEVLEQIRHAGKPPGEITEGFSWKKRRPPLLYHADTYVQSLEDSPNVYKLKQTGSVKVRPNIKRFQQDNALAMPDWTLKTIDEALPAVKLRHVSCFDFALKSTDPNTPAIGISSISGRADRSWRRVAASECRRLAQLLERGNLWELYFLNAHHLHRDFPKLKKEDQLLLRDEDLRSRLFDAYRRPLLRVLNDSMVDLGTKYRLLFVKVLNPTVLEALVYMWHPDALDTFDDHLGKLSHFFDDPSKGGGEMWLSTATISHWRLQTHDESDLSKIGDKIEKDERSDRFQKLRNSDAKEKMRWRERVKRLMPIRTAEEPKWASTEVTDGADRTDAEDGETAANGNPSTAIGATLFPPSTVSDRRARKRPQDGERGPLSTIRELSMSLVMTGDPLGRHWTCTLVCDLVDEKTVSRYAEKINDILQIFIHQQYTGRALVFLLLLGCLCEALSKECENFMEEVDRIMGLDPMVLLKGLKWHKSDVALKKLKDMLWGLEALRVFSDKLEKVLEKIEDAKKAMRLALKRGDDIRPTNMTRELEKVVEEFVKRHGRLKNAYNAINQQIDQGTRLREGITSVLSVEQNENISMLTWVTILYLPLSFIAGVFAMGHDVVPSWAGLSQFAWVNAAFVGGTVIFALSLQLIIRRLRQVQGWAEKGYERVRDDVRNPEPRRSIIQGSALLGDDGLSSQLMRRNVLGEHGARPGDVESGPTHHL